MPICFGPLLLQGVRIFDLKRDKAEEAAAALRRDGFVAVAALGPALLRRMRRLSAALLRRAAAVEPHGNRCLEKRWVFDGI